MNEIIKKEDDRCVKILKTVALFGGMALAAYAIKNNYDVSAKFGNLALTLASHKNLIANK